MAIEPRTALSIEASWKRETIHVSNIGRQLPGDSTTAQQDAVIATAKKNPGVPLDDAAWRVIARSTTRPDPLITQLRPTGDDPFGALLTESVEGATVRSVITRVLTSELLPGIQPRTSSSLMEVPDPQVEGLTHGDNPTAIVEYRYKDPQHLLDHVWHTISTTLSLNSYTTSILTRSVTRNLLVHSVRVTFEDGSPSFHSLVVRDGITRLASMWAVLAGPDADNSDAADLAQKALLGALLSSDIPKNASDLGERICEARAKWRAQLREEFTQEISAEVPGLHAAQIFQSYTAPVQVAVGIEGHAGQILSPKDLFDDAIRSVLSSIHVEFRPWDESAQNVEVITRALKRIIQRKDPRWSTDQLQDVYGLAVGRIPVSALPKAFGSGKTAPATALWRAVYLVNALSKPDLLDALKDQTKSIKGGKRMGLKGFGALLGPVIDLPWRTRKRLVMSQARNAWSNGGVLTGSVTDDWHPVPTDDFTTLVAPAMQGDDDARCTLAVAGGVALIADKLLTRNVGSSLGAPKEKGGVPFRADTNTVIDGLSSATNELGLTILALAANTFRADDLPQNSVARQDLTGKVATENPYVHYRVDLDTEDRIARDSNGIPELLYEWDVVAASRPGWDKKATESAPTPAPETKQENPWFLGAPVTSDGSDTTLTQAVGALATGDALFSDSPAGAVPPVAEQPRRLPSQRAAEQRQDLRDYVYAARNSLDQILTLEHEVSHQSALAPIPLLDELHSLLHGIQTDIENLRRSIDAEQAGATPDHENPDEEAPEE
ncbi:hypothetical protein [Streptomyces laurentii]|uniref:hypothetical protein n=1 Tax=Streptomyces laurentii TaxID=39478 RepID=UPI0036BEB8EF